VTNRVNLNDSEIQKFLRNPFGAVSRLVTDLTSKAAQVARGKVRVRTGKTLASIQEEIHYDDDPYDEPHGGPYGEISAGFAAYFLEKGVNPHLIWSHGDYSLHTETPTGSQNGYMGQVVIHPGFAPKPFLTTSLWSLQNEV